ncbi:DUF2931 family protein [Flavobacterium sp. 140616W15]|uniref:DUF2931 family protein n=1 Tax=Flavobacterium sp. 140616W15 TaxID=2478552 RepID=UPI000F0C3CAE|nr:DUF2931 family protein [Flavobacterium sp. 140616W15]AYN05688.1 DUF2931 family protein [Flavobacterium sp. 140616W15]
MIKKTMLLLLLAITINSCMEKKYEWSASISAPREYPVEVYTGAAGGYFFSQMGGFSNTGWGGGVGDNSIKATLPENLDMTWLSYIDNKFYTGEWKLPTEKIQQLFDEGFHSRPDSDSERDNYSIIKIGLAPKGMVVVWVMGAGHQVEVARFQAHETIIDPKLISEDERYMFRNGYSQHRLENNFVISKDIREQIEQYGYPLPEVYEEYREKFNWKPKVILPEGSKITSMYIKMCNGEMEDPYDLPIDQKNRAIPFSFQIFWSVGSGKQEREFVSRIAFTNDKEYWAKYLEGGENEIPVDFDKNKIRKLFKEDLDKNKIIEMVIKINPNVEIKSERVTDLYLEQDGKRYEIKEKVTRTGKYE